MAYLKPQSPIKNGNDNIYPLTTYDQIIMADGSRWDGITSGVSSVNGKTGVVQLKASDVGAAAASHSHDGVYTTSNLIFSLDGTTLTITTT